MTIDASRHDGVETPVSEREAHELRAENQKWATKLFWLGWFIEIVLVSVGLGVAFAQAASIPGGTSLLQAVPVFGVFVVLSAVELAKIPAATVVFHARGMARYLALGGLLVASVISFETVFNGIERYAHVTTHPVSVARDHHAALLGEIEQLRHSGQDDLTGDDIARADAERMAQLEQALAIRDRALQDARADLESQETRELKAQLANLIQQQNEAGDQAGADWQEYMDDLRSRASDASLSNDMRSYAERVIRQQPKKVTVVDAARAKFDAEILKLNQAIEGSITEPSPEALENVARKQAERDAAAQALTAFERDSSRRADERTATLQDIQSDKAERSRQIEALEAEAVVAQREIAYAAQLSQMHRWASFVFGVEPSEVQDNQAKAIGAIFGAVLGVVASLTGASVAMYSQWFHVRGVQPVVRIQEVAVEKIVEKEVEVTREVEVPVLHHVYVPVPVGNDLEQELDAILEALPPEAARALRDQLASGFAAPDALPASSPPADEGVASPRDSRSGHTLLSASKNERSEKGDDHARAA
ncbi:coiled-coil domain-containing protein [Ruegeria aquimaris]|uniref:Chromosome partition protein Smc n=1 Tax=Ruegeria aquimaris TaxID=2984333 RepID=A0ABT3APT1_9RHOB|nr:hypothetical protein [Ruegeria sp. XHP0148]MCV2890673.1 hypothetical protein [Ruegeria sp. XHP0148]